MEPNDIAVYMVGGAIRDEILGVRNKDIDFSVEAPSYEAMRDFILERGRIYLETPEFFTIRAHIDDLNGWKGDADFVLCRKEYGYSDGRRPDTVEVGDIYDDLARRDFTMNSISRIVYPNVENEYYDPFGGVSDILRGRIRCVGNPRERMAEDALRMLRAMRFSITKQMDLDVNIKSILKNVRYLTLLRDNISTERKKDELVRMFKFSTIKTIMVLNQYPGIMDAVFGDGVIWMKATNELRK
jgi:tRNA nucleotidyltransferase/poly(A) polymerase